MVQAIRSRGYNVLAVTDSRAARSLAEHYESKIDLLLTDVVMPNLSGPELAKELLSFRPDTKVLYVTGYAPSVVRKESFDDDIPILAKPFGSHDLARKVRELLQ